MAKYIDSDEAQKVLNDVLTDVDDIEEEEPEEYVDGFVCGVGVALNKLEAIIPVDVAPVRHGHWICTANTWTHDLNEAMRPIFYCSVCGRYEKIKEPFCNCGAKMDEKEQQDNE